MEIQRIVFVIPTMQSGGAERVVSIIANYWAAQNYQVHIISFDEKPSFFALNEKIKYHNLKSARNSKWSFNKIVNNINRAKNYYLLLKKVKPDIVLSFTRNANVYCLLYNLVLKNNIIIGETTNPSFPILPRGLNKLPWYVYKYANAIVVQTNQSYRIFEQLKINLPQKRAIIYNPLSSYAFTNTQNSPRKNIVLAVGRLVNKTKQFDKLINIFHACENDNWQLHIAGVGSDYHKLQQQIKRLRLDNKVFLLGSVDNIATIYSTAKIFALTSSREGFPNALCEAMANGCACVSYDCPTGPADIIKHNINGILIEMGNEEKFKQSLCFLMKNEDAVNRLSVEGQKLIAALEPKKIIKNWENLIDEVVLKKTISVVNKELFALEEENFTKSKY